MACEQRLRCVRAPAQQALQPTPAGAIMSDLETRLLEFWKADAAVWRRKMHVYEHAEQIETVGSACERPPSEKSPMSRICAQCGEAFTTGRVDRKYCSERCRREVDRKQERVRAAAKRRAKGAPVRHRRVRGMWNSIELADAARVADGFRCIVCREPFTPSPGERGERRPPLYCSATCRMRAHRIRAAAG